jgi:hypothetical protein
MAGAWNVPAGTKSNLKIKRKGFKVVGGAIEHKNRPEAVYTTISSWVKPKLSLTRAKASSMSDPNDLAKLTAKDFEQEVKRMSRKLASCFDSEYFDPNSIIWTLDYAAGSGEVGKRQFLEIEINIDTVNTIGNDDQPSPNPSNGKVEMYTYKDLESHLAKGVDKVLALEPFDEGKSLVDFADKKGVK